MSTETTGRRTIRRFAHELYPHAGEDEIRALHIEVPYLYSRAVGLEIDGTNWFAARPYSIANERTQAFIDASRLALVADALLQGLTGDDAWRWARERLTDDSEFTYERAEHFGVPIRSIKPYPCNGEPDHHDHLGVPDLRGFSVVTRIPGTEDDCEECTEPIPAPPQVEQLDLTGTEATR